jgi:hypothetical protein
VGGGHSTPTGAQKETEKKKKTAVQVKNTAWMQEIKLNKALGSVRTSEKKHFRDLMNDWGFCKEYSSNGRKKVNKNPLPKTKVGEYQHNKQPPPSLPDETELGTREVKGPRGKRCNKRDNGINFAGARKI